MSAPRVPPWHLDVSSKGTGAGWQPGRHLYKHRRSWPPCGGWRVSLTAPVPPGSPGLRQWLPGGHSWAGCAWQKREYDRGWRALHVNTWTLPQRLVLGGCVRRSQGYDARSWVCATNWGLPLGFVWGKCVRRDMVARFGRKKSKCSWYWGDVREGLDGGKAFLGSSEGDKWVTCVWVTEWEGAMEVLGRRPWKTMLMGVGGAERVLRGLRVWVVGWISVGSIRNVLKGLGVGGVTGAGKVLEC